MKLYTVRFILRKIIYWFMIVCFVFFMYRTIMISFKSLYNSTSDVVLSLICPIIMYSPIVLFILIIFKMIKNMFQSYFDSDINVLKIKYNLIKNLAPVTDEDAKFLCEEKNKYNIELRKLRENKIVSHYYKESLDNLKEFREENNDI